jgi:hypothetical protein
MSDSVFVAGGFGQASTSPMSDDLRIRMEAAEQLVEADIAKQEQARKRRAEIFAERAQRDAIQAAIAEGQVFSPAMLRGEGLGHEPHEFIRQRSEMMDREDQHADALRAAEYRRWLAEHYASTSADTSAPTAEQVEEARLDAERTAYYKDRMIERRVTLRYTAEQAKAIAARGDRQIVGAVAAALGSESGYDNQASYRTAYTGTGLGGSRA